MGKPATTFCRFLVMFSRRRMRTAENPFGLGQFAEEQEGNALAAFSRRVASAAMKVGTWWTVEYPRSSSLRALLCVQGALQRPGVGDALLVYCRFNLQHRRQTRFVGTLRLVSRRFHASALVTTLR